MMEDSYVETKVEALEDNRTKVTVTVDAADIEHHVLLLGLELIAYPFRIESGDSGKLTVETEA